MPKGALPTSEPHTDPKLLVDQAFGHPAGAVTVNFPGLEDL